MSVTQFFPFQNQNESCDNQKKKKKRTDKDGSNLCNLYKDNKQF